MNALLKFYLNLVSSSAVDEAIDRSEDLQHVLKSLSDMAYGTERRGSDMRSDMRKAHQERCSELLWDCEEDWKGALLEAFKAAADLERTDVNLTAVFAQAVLLLGNAEAYWNKEQGYVV